jgi:hypothetical protein
MRPRLELADTGAIQRHESCDAVDLEEYSEAKHATSRRSTGPQLRDPSAASNDPLER